MASLIRMNEVVPAPIGSAVVQQLEINLLRSFVLIYEFGSVTAAAERQHLTQSAVSMQMRRLENLLGRSLLRQSGRKMTATEDGLVLLQYARKILELNDQAIGQLTGVALSGEVRCGFVEDVAAYGMIDILKRFHADHPLVRLQIHIGQSHQLMLQLDSGSLDIVLAKSAPDGRTGQALVSDPLIWVAAPDYRLPRHGSLPLICAPPPCVNRLAMTSTLARMNRSFHVVCLSATQGGINMAVLAGLGVTAMPEQVIIPDLQRFEALALPPLPRRSIQLFRGERQMSPVVDEMIVYLSERFGAGQRA